MLAFDSVKLRLERQQELSFLEFNYMILQAYDFVELYRRHGCVLQMGGSDQWGNIVSGIDLGRRHAQRAALRADLAAHHHVLGRQDGQDRGRRGLAQSRSGEPLRVLAILAQHRGRRRRPLLEVVHGAAARRDRRGSPRSRAGDQRGEKGARHRSDRARARPRGRRRPRRPRARPSRKARSREGCRPSRCRGGARAVSACSAPSSAPASPRRTAKRAVQIQGGALRVNDARVTGEKRPYGEAMSTPTASSNSRSAGSATFCSSRCSRLKRVRSARSRSTWLGRRRREFENLAQQSRRQRRDRVDVQDRTAAGPRPRR